MSRVAAAIACLLLTACNTVGGSVRGEFEVVVPVETTTTQVPLEQ